jgi:PAS domain S-box-containing protein
MNVLLVEDNPDDALIVREMLLAAGGHAVTVVPTLAQASADVASRNWDCILLDLSLPDADGLHAVNELHGAVPGTPILVLTGLDDERRGLEAIRAGAHDYLLKGQVGGPDLSRAIRYTVEREQFSRTAISSPRGRSVLSAHGGLPGRAAVCAIALASAALAMIAIAADGGVTLVEALFALSLATLAVALTLRSIGLDAGFRRPVQVVEQSDAAMMSLRLPEMTIDSWNPSAAKLFGYSARDAIGRGPAFLIPEDVQDEAGLMLAGVRDGKRIVLETRRLHRDGREIEVSLIATPLTDERGRVTGASVLAVAGAHGGTRALGRAEERFRSAFANAPAGMGIVSLADGSHGRLLQVNVALCTLTGFSEAELLTKDLVAMTHPDDRAHEAAVLDALLNGDRDTYELEKRMVRADGESVWVQADGSLIRDDAGRPLYGLGQVVDVTHRKRADEVRSRLAAIVESSADAVVATDTNGGIQAWNPAAEEMFGHLQADVLGRDLSILMPPDVRNVERPLIDRALAGESLRALETKRLRLDGTVLPVSISVSPIRDEHGAIIGASEIARDITAVRDAATALRSSDERLRQIVDTANEGIWAVDKEGCTTFANHKLAEILGTTVEAMDGASVFDFVHDEDRAETARQLALRRDGIADQFQFRLARADGGDSWGLLSVSGLFDHEGNSTGSLAMVADVTERRATERELGQWQRLEGLGQLAGGVAHDMNNLLGVILNFSDFALETVGDGPGSEELTEIHGAAERAAGLTRQLLVFARQEVTRPEIVDLNALLSDLEKLLRRTIGENIVLTSRHEPGLPVVRADPGLVEQVIMNLVVNARDAMPSGGEVVVATGVMTLAQEDRSSHGDLPAGTYVRMSVTDDGEGMSEAVAERAFEPFFSTKPVGSGTGLGLPTVYGVVTKAGGRVQIYSELGRGTEVRVYLPASSSAAEVSETAPVDGVAASAEGTVLVVEDDSGLRKVTVRILEQHGYEVLVADGPTTALELARQRGSEIDLVVTDVVMPEMSGPQLAAHLGQTLPELPVLFVSGYTAHPGDLPDGARFLSKPFTREGLLRGVAQATS